MLNNYGRYTKRCQRYDAQWSGHYLTFSCYRNKPLLGDHSLASWFIEVMQAARQKHGFLLYAYVVMPEHVHPLIVPGDGDSISKILYDLKKPMTNRVIAWAIKANVGLLAQMEQRSGRHSVHRFWQTGGGYDRNVWTAEEIHEKIRYIHLNPVRRGLVERAIDWPWPSARAWEMGCDMPVPIDRASVPMLET